MASVREIEARAHATEKACRVPEENISALRAIGYFDIVKPARFGGYEHDFDVLVDLNIELAKSCASTAWVAGLLAAHQWLIASFPEQAQRDVWDENPDAVACGSYAPAAKAIPADGGYRLSGRWSFASGCDNAQWSLCAALLPAEAEGGPLTPAFLLVRAADYTHRRHLECGRARRDRQQDARAHGRFRAGAPGVELRRRDQRANAGRCAICGKSRLRRSDALQHPVVSRFHRRRRRQRRARRISRAHQRARITRGAVAGSNNRMAEFPTIQLRVAEAAASVDAARTLLLRDLRERAATVRAGRPVSVEERILSRRGQAFAVSLAIRAAEALNASTGGQGLDLSNPVQRAWRDANAVGRHISMNWDAVGTMYGQMALGLPPQGQY